MAAVEGRESVYSKSNVVGKKYAFYSRFVLNSCR